MATFTLNVPDHLLPRLGTDGRRWLFLHYELDSTGYTDLQVMREVTRRQWEDMMVESEQGEAIEHLRGEANDEVGGIT